ncbi:MAG: hypothetical protein ACNA8W_00310 [Bradymonadaceae bacterium]
MGIFRAHVFRAHGTGKAGAPKAVLSIALVRLLVHGLGVLIMAAVLLIPFWSRPAYQSALLAHQSDELWSFLGWEFALHMGLAACIWALGWIVVALVKEWRKQEPRPLRVVSARGSVMTETLITMPVLLLLIFGLGQLTVNNIAGVLTNLATFQAARVVWLWEGEPEPCGGGGCDVQDRARIQAALVLTPAAPGEYNKGNDLSARAEQVRGIMVGSQRPWPSSDMGFEGMEMADDVLADDGPGWGTNFTGAIDASSFIARSARKFTFAYEATEITYSTSADEVTVELKYKHFAAFPIVGRIFGEVDTVGGRTGYFATFNRVYTQDRLPEANRQVPQINPVGPPFF